MEILDKNGGDQDEKIANFKLELLILLGVDPVQMVKLSPGSHAVDKKSDIKIVEKILRK